MCYVQTIGNARKYSHILYHNGNISRFVACCRLLEGALGEPQASGLHERSKAAEGDPRLLPTARWGRRR
jgi:hypothetical protein